MLTKDEIVFETIQTAAAACSNSKKQQKVWRNPNQYWIFNQTTYFCLLVFIIEINYPHVEDIR